jgi:PBSX family phage terminase large subunit
MMLTSAQKQIANCKNRFRVINCGRRFGKTTLATLEIVGKAVMNENQRIAYVAPTYQQARDIAWNEIKRHLPPDSSANPEYNESRLEIKVNTGSTIVLRGWESIETLRGQAFDYIVIDEVAMMRNFWSNWQEVIRPTLTDTRGKVMFISTPKGFNHFYDLYNLATKDNDYASFHFTSYDNPFLPVEELNKAKQELTEDRFAQEYLADFRKTEGLVYKEFDRTKHIYKDIPINSVLYFAGIDFGFTNPCAVISIKKDNDNKFYVTKEWYKTGKTEDEVAEYVASCKFNLAYPDPEAASAIETLRRHKIGLREVTKGKDSIRTGISIIRELFKQNRLFIHESCENLVYELETYSYPDKKDLHNEEENPIKENDHALDALRYALSMQVTSQQSNATQFYPKAFQYIKDTPQVYYPKR